MGKREETLAGDLCSIPTSVTVYNLELDYILLLSEPQFLPQTNIC